MSKTKALVLAAAMLLPLPADAAKSCQTQVYIYDNGDIGIDGTRYSEHAKLKLQFNRVHPRCTVALRFDKGVSYASVVEVLRLMQRKGVLKIGFANEIHID